MQCEMCGKDTNLIKTLIEGSELNVCNRCTKHGKILPKPKKIIIKPKQQYKGPQLFLTVVNDYSQKVKQRRESLGLKQEDLAKTLNEKWSIIQKIESNHFKPSLKLARKLEKFLKIKLVEQREEEKVTLKTSKDVLTIGDLIKTLTLLYL